MRTLVTLAAVAAVVTLRTLGALELPAAAPAAEPPAAEVDAAAAEPGTLCTCWNGAGDALASSAD